VTTRTMTAMIKRRSAIEPTIGHMKSDGRLDRNPLKGALGDALHSFMWGNQLFWSRQRQWHPLR
jgi:IS5 family transposase